MIRRDTSYNVAIMAFMKGKTKKRACQPTVETEKEIRRAFKEAMNKRIESEAFKHRLRVSQIQTLLLYKRQVSKGKIADFKDSFDILSKIHWFERFNFEMREKLVNKAEIVIYEPGDVIIEQNAESPTVNVILRGSVEVSVRKNVWNYTIDFTLSTFFDGQLFGEIADFES